MLPLVAAHINRKIDVKHFAGGAEREKGKEKGKGFGIRFGSL